MGEQAKGAAARPLPRTTASGDPVPWPPAAWEVPATAEERLQCIAALVDRIAALARLLPAGVGGNGLSAEARDRSIRVFHERLLRAERELRAIQEQSRLD